MSSGLTLKLQCCQGQLAWFPMVTISAAALRTMKARQILKRDKPPRPVLVCCFARSAAYEVKGRQVATGNGDTWSWQQHDFNAKTWLPNLVTPYSIDNRSSYSGRDRHFDPRYRSAQIRRPGTSTQCNVHKLISPSCFFEIILRSV